MRNNTEQDSKMSETYLFFRKLCKMESKLVHRNTFEERHQVARKGLNSLGGIKECFLEEMTHE